MQCGNLVKSNPFLHEQYHIINVRSKCNRNLLLGFASDGNCICFSSIRIRTRIRIILFWINKYEYNLCYNDIYTYKNDSRMHPGHRYKDMCQGTSVTIRLPGQ